MNKSPRLANIRYDLLAACGFLVISLFYAWQVTLHFSDHIAGHGGDGWQNLWNMWWFERALADGQNPYFTDMLHHPTGTTLLFHTLSPLTCLLALPFKWLFGPVAAYNILFLSYFVASGFTMYLLVKEITQHRLAGFLAGCVFTFSHYHFAHAQSHLNLLGMQWFPLFLLFLIRSWNTGRLKDFIWLGVTLALLVYTEVYYAVFAATCAFFSAVVQSITTPKQVFTKSNLVRYGTAVLTFAVTGGILIFFMIAAYFETEFVKAHDPRYYSADLQGYFVPGWISAWSGAFADVWRHWTGNNAECSWYLGYSVLTLCVLAFVLGPKDRRPWRWASLTLIGLILALGPVLHWGGSIYDSIPLPFQLFEVIFPLVKMSGVPGRWHFLALVGTSVMAGIGLAALLGRLPSRTWFSIPIPWIGFGVCLLVVLTEMAPRFIETRSAKQPNFISQLRSRPADEVVFDLGDWNRALLRQIGHQHRMIGGYISRCTQKADDFWLRSDFTQTIRGYNRMSKPKVWQKAQELNLRFIIYPTWHKPKPNLSRLGFIERYREGNLRVWEIPGSPQDTKNKIKS